MKILITGTAGFIGFHVAQALLKRGDEVIGLDNFNSYYSVKLKEDRTSLLQQHFPKFYSIRADLHNKQAMENLFDTYTFDVVCNLAAQAGVRYSLTHPHTYVQSNIVGFLNILEACRHHGIPRLVYASSSSVYGGNEQLPFSEKDRVDTPISLYAASKKSNELMAHVYTHLFGLQTIGLRFFTVYGPWGRPDMALWLFTEAILNNKPIEVFNNGEMYRDFTYIDDIVSGVIACIEKPHLSQYEVFNLGNNNSENLMDMICCIEANLQKKAIKEFKPMQPGDVKATYADIEHAQKMLGFEPKTKIQEGIPKFIQWYREYFSI